VRRLVFPLVLALAAAAVLGAVLLPLVGLFTRTSPGEIVHQLGTRTARDALLVSLRTNLIAEALIVAVGTPAAYFLATRRFPGRALVLTVVELPLVLPPAVGGIALLAAFGRFGLLQGAGGLPFTQAGVVAAICFVAAPFYVRPAVASFENVDTGLVDAARTLGAGQGRVFARVALPLAAGGLGAAAGLAFARGLGEFGATIMFAGSLQGVTQTLPLAIYAAFSVDLDTAVALGVLLVVVSAALLLAIKLVPSWTRFGLTSPSRSAASG
jgi:molybdate transport system permease protein